MKHNKIVMCSNERGLWLCKILDGTFIVELWTFYTEPMIAGYEVSGSANAEVWMTHAEAYRMIAERCIDSLQAQRALTENEAGYALALLASSTVVYNVCKSF